MDDELATRLRTIVVRLTRQLNATAAIEGLTPTQASVLALTASRGPLSIAEVTRLEGLNPTMVSRIVGRLAALGLIRREADPADQRSGLLFATADGDAVSERIRAGRSDIVASALGRIASDQRQAITSAIGALEALSIVLGDASTSSGGPSVSTTSVPRDTVSNM